MRLKKEVVIQNVHSELVVTANILPNTPVTQEIYERNRSGQVFSLFENSDGSVLFKLDDRYCLTVLDGKLMIQEENEDQTNQQFKINGDYIELSKSYPKKSVRVLDVPASSCEPGCEIITYPNYETENQQWKIHTFTKDLILKNKLPRPAAYATIWWKFKCDSDEDWSHFELSNSCVVDMTHACTYYALLGYHGESFEGMDDGGRGSGGYGGVQVKEDGRTLLIFSVWDGPVLKTKCISSDHESDCIVRRFGNEGVGMQCLLHAPWCPGDLITQKIYGKQVYDVKDTSEKTIQSQKQLIKWHLSSEFEISGKNGLKTYKMATYEWHGYQHPLTNKLSEDGNGTTYSFLEDWNTSPKADGHLHQRSVFYLNPSLSSSNKTFEPDKHIFQTTHSNHHKQAEHKIIQQVTTCRDRKAYFVSTGGDEEEIQKLKSQI
jgi:hypothetical protein